MKAIVANRPTKLYIILVSLLFGAVLLLSRIMPSFAQGDADAPPPPPSVGADVPITYFGAPPSTFQKELVGPLQLLRSGTVDEEARTVTLPLYLGVTRAGENVWYILTDTTDKGNADALGLNWSAKLAYANVQGATRTARLQPDLSLLFNSGTVDFSPERVLTPNAEPNFFPPAEAVPGAVGDAAYSPLVRIVNAGDHIYNAPIVAFGVDAEQIAFCDTDPDYSLVHDNVVRICPGENGGGTVTLKMAVGFSFAKTVLYLSTEASDPVAATLENVTYAPAMANIRVGFDDGAFSAVERLFAAVNGPTGVDNPQRQGFNSALSDGEGLGPLNVFGGLPTVALDYSPMWDANIYEWTQEAIDSGYRARNIDEFEVLALAEQGWITAPGGGPFGSSGIIVNCPIVMRFL